MLILRLLSQLFGLLLQAAAAAVAPVVVAVVKTESESEIFFRILLRKILHWVEAWCWVAQMMCAFAACLSMLGYTHSHIWI